MQVQKGPRKLLDLIVLAGGVKAKWVSTKRHKLTIQSLQQIIKEQTLFKILKEKQVQLF